MSDKRVHAFCDDALGDLDAVGVAERIASGEVSAAEMAAAAIARAERVNPQLHAIELATFEQALADWHFGRTELPPGEASWTEVRVSAS